MKIKQFLIKTLMTYFVLVTCITVAILILGMYYEPDAKLSYEAFRSPLIFGLVGVIPSIITYSRSELTVKQLAVRKVIQLILIEAAVLAMGYQSPAMSTENPIIVFELALSVFVIYLIANLVRALQNYTAARKMTEDLIQLQSSEQKTQFHDGTMS